MSFEIVLLDLPSLPMMSDPNLMVTISIDDGKN